MNENQTGPTGIDLEPTTVDDLRRRLRKVEGQVRGIQNLLADVQKMFLKLA